MRPRSLIVYPALFLAFLAGGCWHHSTTALQRPDGTPPRRALAHYIDGVFYDMNDNPAAALISYQEALLYDSTSPDLHLAIGIDYLRLGKEDAGIMAVKRALRYNPAEKKALGIMAEYYLEKNRLSAADSVFQQMIAHDSTSAEAWFGLGMIAQQQRKNEKARFFYHRVIEIDPAFDPRVYDFLGSLYLQQGEFDKGEDVYRKSLEVYPDNGLAHNRLGMISEARGDTAAAVRFYEKAVQAAPGFREPLSRLAGIYSERSQWQDAQRLYRTTLAADSSDIDSWLGLAAVFASMGEIDSAKTVYRHVQEEFAEDGRADLILGRIYLEEEAYSKAFDNFIKITEKFPRSPDGWLESGRALLLADSLEKAAVYLRRAVAADNDNFFANYLLGTVLTELGENVGAVAFLEKSLESVFEPARRLPIIGSLASAYDGLGRHRMADSLFQQALSIEPGNATILNNYSYSLALRGEKLDLALQMALKALEQEPENGAFLDTVGWIHFLKGSYETAAVYIEKAWHVRQTSAEVAEHLGDVYEKLGRTAHAKEAWEAARSLEPENERIRKKAARYSE